jgi:hypothetical protein
MFRNIYTSARSRMQRSLRWPIALIVFMVGTATLGAVPVAQAVTAAVIPPVTATPTVSATRGWQQTSINIAAGQTFTVSYISGTWTVDHRNFPSVGPGGYSDSIDRTIYQGCKYNSHRNYAVLLGVVGQSASFPIGEGGIFKAAASGPLYLRINDDNACLGDNAGSVKMYVSTIGQVPNYSYAGYTAVAGGNGAFGLVEATWVVPKIPLLYCLAHPGAYPRVAPWVGLWGTYDSIKKGTAWLPQIGTVSRCNSGFPGPHYLAFWEMFTGVKGGGAKNFGAGPQIIRSMTIKPGDTMTGAVEYEKGKSGSNLVFKLTLFDVTRTKPGSPDQFSITVTTTKPVKFSDIMAQGGAVVEPECNHGLAKFTSVPFTDVQVVPWNGTPQPAGINLNKWTMIGSDKTTLAQPGALSGFPGLMKYTVTYQASGPTAC